MKYFDWLLLVIGFLVVSYVKLNYGINWCFRV